MRIFIVKFLFIFFGMFIANLALADQVMEAKSTWEPILKELSYDEVRKANDAYRAEHNITTPSKLIPREEFENVKGLVYETLAEIFTKEDFDWQNQMIHTAVGKRVASNMPRRLMGLSPLPISPDSFTTQEISEWESFAEKNQEGFANFEEKMSKLPKALASKKTKLSNEGKGP